MSPRDHSPCGIHLYAAPVERCAFCDALLDELRVERGQARAERFQRRMTTKTHGKHSKRYDYRGERLTLSEIAARPEAREKGLSANALKLRIARTGVSAEEAVAFDPPARMGAWKSRRKRSGAHAA